MKKLDHLTGLNSQQAVEAVGNRYDLVLIAAARARELSRGHRAKVISNHSHGVTAIGEIEHGLVGRDYLLKEAPQDRTRTRRKFDQ
jgi:DNA-directed RNA polymerase omega subunit